MHPPTANEKRDNNGPLLSTFRRSRRATRVLEETDFSQGFAEHEPHIETSRRRHNKPRHETVAIAVAVALQRFLLLQFFYGFGRNWGASDTRTDNHSVAVVGPRAPAREDPWPELPDPAAMERREQKQTTTTSTHHRTSNHFPSRSHTPNHHTHLPLLANHHKPPQVLDHPHSKLGVGGQAPPHTSPTTQLAGTNQATKPKVIMWDRATSRRPATPTATAFTTSKRHPIHAVALRKRAIRCGGGGVAVEAELERSPRNCPEAHRITNPLIVDCASESMCGMMYGMRRTTIYLPDELKVALERTATAEGRSEAEVVRSALVTATAEHVYPPPRLPLFSSGDPTLAERVDEELARGFGE